MAEAIEEDDDFMSGESVDHYSVFQFHVFAVIEFSSQYGSDHSISYTAQNVIGGPKVYPESVDSTACFQMRSYGPWRRLTPSYTFIDFRSVLPVDMHVQSEDFIELKFPDRVYPTCIDFYETFNPGAVTRIFGYCYEQSRWKLLWSDCPKKCHSNSCIFKVHLGKFKIMTNCLRVEFYHGLLDYYYAMDSVMLSGSLEYPLSLFKKPINDHHVSSVALSNKFLRSEQTEEPSESIAGGFERLPHEVMLLLLGFLDLKSLCAASQVSSWFKSVCYDPILYRVLDLQLYWNQVNPSMLNGLSGRCSSLQLLSLSWCGSRNVLTPQYVVQFIEKNCGLLTSLKLSNCSFVNNHVLKAAASTCKSLQVLELRSCLNQDLSYLHGFLQVSLMKHLVYLDLYRTAVDRYSIITIIKSCPKIEHLLLGACHNIDHYNDVVQEIGSNLRNLKTLELWRARSLTEAGVFVLSELCQGLVELDLGWCISVNSNNGCIRQLVKNCTKLKKLFLTAMRTVSDSELAAIANHSKELEQLDILGTREITYEGVRGVLQACNNLKLLDISFCQRIDENSYQTLQYDFPGVQIKRSIRSGVGN